MTKKYLTALSVVVVVLFINLNPAIAKDNVKKDLKYYSNSIKSGDFLVRSHGDAGLSCKDCHDDGLPKITKNTAKLNLGDTFCLSCHDIEDVNKKVVYQYKGDEVFPHSQHVGDMQCADCHSMHQASTLMCADCHVQPWMKTLPARWKQIK
ncbi:cytochrome c3 family protein [Shewanella sp. A14]